METTTFVCVVTVESQYVSMGMCMQNLGVFSCIQELTLESNTEPGWHGASEIDIILSH